MSTTRHLIILTLVEGLVISTAMIRLTIPGLGGDLSNHSHRLWLLATVLFSTFALAHYVVRAAGVAPRLKAGESVEEARKKLFTACLVHMLVLGLLSLAGPQVMDWDFG